MPLRTHQLPDLYMTCRGRFLTCTCILYIVQLDFLTSFQTTKTIILQNISPQSFKELRTIYCTLVKKKLLELFNALVVRVGHPKRAFLVTSYAPSKAELLRERVYECVAWGFLCGIKRLVWPWAIDPETSSSLPLTDGNIALYVDGNACRVAAGCHS